MKNIFTVCTFFISTFILAQNKSDSLKQKRSEEKSPAIQLGYNGAYEIGMGKFTSIAAGPHQAWSLIYFGSEFKKYNNNFLWAPKIGIWASGGCCGGSAGLSLIYYINSKETSLKFRPEIGVGFFILRFYYGYNITIINKDFVPVSRNVFGANLVIPTNKSIYKHL